MTSVQLSTFCRIIWSRDCSSAGTRLFASCSPESWQKWNDNVRCSSYQLQLLRCLSAPSNGKHVDHTSPTFKFYWNCLPKWMRCDHSPEVIELHHCREVQSKTAHYPNECEVIWIRQVPSSASSTFLIIQFNLKTTFILRECTHPLASWQTDEAWSWCYLRRRR